MQAALRETVVLGVVTNLARLQAVVDHPAFVAGALHTGFLDEHLGAPVSPEPLPEAALAGVAAVLASAGLSPGPAAGPVTDPFSTLGPWRLGA